MEYFSLDKNRESIRYEKDSKEGLSYSRKGPKSKVNNPTTPLEILEAENAKLKKNMKD